MYGCCWLGLLQVEAEFLPWLTQQAVAHVERGLLARSVVAALVADAVALRESEQQGAAALADAQAAAAEAYAAKASGWSKLQVAAQQGHTSASTCSALRIT
jgi:hypothetical protein